MSLGRVWQSESITRRDEGTGAAVRQITTHRSLHHHPFFYLPAFDDAMQWLIFVSHRAGFPAIFAEERTSGKLVQLTDRDDLNEWSVHPSCDGEHVYYTAGCEGWRVRIDDQKEEALARLGAGPLIPPGMVGDAMGTTSLSRDGRWWAVPVKRSLESAALYIIDTLSGEVSVAAEAPVIGHPQFHPADSGLLHYAGTFRERLWVVRRDGSGHRLAHRRPAWSKQWLVHEVWNPARPELLVVDWPHGMIGVDIGSGDTRKVCRFNAWHAAPSRDGKSMVCDTNWPDRGLMLFNPQDGIGEPKRLCESAASNAGHHWQTDHCPYDDGPVKVYAPQHTHPHPSFSPDGRYVVFTSDVTGVSHIYEVDLNSL